MRINLGGQSGRTSAMSPRHWQIHGAVAVVTNCSSKYTLHGNQRCSHFPFTEGNNISIPPTGANPDAQVNYRAEHQHPFGPFMTSVFMVLPLLFVQR